MEYGCVGCHADRALCTWADAHPDLRARPDACPCAYSIARRGAPTYLNTRGVSHTNSRLHADLDTRPRSILSYCRNTPLHARAWLLRGPV